MNNFRNFALWIIIGLLLMALFNVFQGPGQRSSSSEISYSTLLAEVDGGNVREVTITGNRIAGKFNDGRAFQSYAPSDPDLVSHLNERGVQITAQPIEDNALLSVLISWFPMLLLIGVWIFFLRQMQGGGGRAMGFGKSKAKLLTERHGRVTFDDVAGHR